MKKYSVITYCDYCGADEGPDFDTIQEARSWITQHKRVERKLFSIGELVAVNTGFAIIHNKHKTVVYLSCNFPREGIFSPSVTYAC